MDRSFFFYSTYQINQLRQVETEPDRDDLAVVTDRSNEPVVVAEKVVVKSFSVRIGNSRTDHQPSDDGGNRYHRTASRSNPATM